MLLIRRTRAGCIQPSGKISIEKKKGFLVDKRAMAPDIPN
jgi:hypothetical protein